MFIRGSGGPGGFVMYSADLEHLEGCHDGILCLPHCTGLYFSPISGIKLGKVGI